MPFPHGRPQDPAIEYAILLASGNVFYTGGFDEPPSRKHVRWEAGINGTFSEHPQAKWYITYIVPSEVIAVIDYRTEEQDEQQAAAA